MTDVQKRTAPRRFRSLASTLIRSIAAAGAICTLAVAALQIALTYREQRQNFEAEVRSIARVNVPLLSVNLWDIEPDAIRRQLQLIAERPQIAYVRLDAVSGQRFESGSPTRREDARTVILGIPYPEGKPGRLGTLQLAPNVEHLYTVLVADVLRLLAAFGLLIGLICIVTSVILRRQLQLPMKHIADFAASLRPNELTRPLTLQRPSRRSRDEIDEVADGFRLLQDDIRRHVDQLDQLVAQRTAELEAKSAELEAASKHKSQFLANMSHELRTPLNAIIGVGEMLLEDARDLEREHEIEPLERILRAGQHLLALINDILDLSKIDAGKMEVHLQTVDTAHLMHEIAATIRPLAEKNGNRVEVDCATDLGPVHADPMRLRQALLNLASNAAKFTDNGTITIAGHRASENGRDWTVLAVTDTGIGMNSEQISRLFQDFVQADASTTRKYGGTGLGLAISRRFCRMMGGDIAVESAPGRGSTFTIRLPGTVVTPQKVVTAHDGSAPAPSSICASMRGRVLLVDDDAMIRRGIRLTLEPAGWEVTEAEDGRSALARLAEARPDAIVLEVMMPEMDGFEFLAEMRSRTGLCDIPVVVLTGRELTTQDRNRLNGGVERIIQKTDRDAMLREVCGVLTKFLERGRGEKMRRLE
jgi:signal transduction histidine kinase